MNKLKFGEQISKLSSIYGEHAFQEAKIAAIWDIVCELSDRWIEITTKKLINTCRFPPMPSDFFEEAQQEKIKGRCLNIPEGLNKPHPGPMSEKTITLLAEWKKKNRDPGGAA